MDIPNNHHTKVDFKKKSHQVGLDIWANGEEIQPTRPINTKSKIWMFGLSLGMGLVRGGYFLCVVTIVQLWMFAWANGYTVCLNISPNNYPFTKWDRLVNAYE